MLKQHHIDKLRAMRPHLRTHVLPNYNPDSKLAKQVRTEPSLKHLSSCTMAWDHFIANGMIKPIRRK